MLKSVLNQPLKSAPGGMHLNRFFQTVIMRHLDIGVTTTDMREHGTILILQLFKQIRSGISIGINVGEVIDQRVRRAVNLATFLHM